VERGCLRGDGAIDNNFNNSSVNRAWAAAADKKRKDTFKEDFSTPGVPVSVGLREECKERSKSTTVKPTGRQTAV
jgi:hypothetical protein